MNLQKSTFRLRVEELETRNAPTANLVQLIVTPPAAAVPAAAHVADQGCSHGIDAHANAASNGVVQCGNPR